MGNSSFSLPQAVVTEADVLDFVRDNPDIFVDLSEELQEKGVKRHRIRGMSAEDWWNTNWGKMLKHENIRDPETREGKEFRRRFRVPAPFFLDWLVPTCKEQNIFQSSYSINGKCLDVIPLEIKLLVSLRMLARGNVVDDIVEFSQVSAAHS